MYTPQVEDIVICKIVITRNEFVKVHILATKDAEIPYYLGGLLYKGNVQRFESHSIQMNDKFFLGDIIRAKIIEIAERGTVMISTVGDEYGVIVAKSRDGALLQPVNWKEMADPNGKTYRRKVAKY